MESVIRRVLSLNCGSSSLKFGVFDTLEKARLLFEGEAEEIGSKGSAPNHEAALRQAIATLRDKGLDQVDAIGHRIVHGGPKLREHQELTEKALGELRDAMDFAPLHLPSALAVIEEVSKAMPGKPQAICLDTAFHREMPDVARTLALAADVRGMGVERYGFHGLSLESIVAQFDKVPERLVVAHLGNGSSITAIHQGKSIDTSMGLTPTGGVMMGSRTGDLDPGVLIYLMRHGYADASRMEKLVDKESGLKGVSGVSNDVRELMKIRRANSQADLALRMFGYQVRKTIASMIGALGGLDTLVFTGGIGEHDEELRQEVTQHLQFCGNFEVKVLPAEEDLQIARITAKLFESGGR